MHDGRTDRPTDALCTQCPVSGRPRAVPNAVSSPGAFNKIHAPAVMWAGWYDIFLQGNLNGYYIYQHLSDAEVRGKSYLVVDPFGHCQDAAKYFPKNTGTLASRKALAALLSVQMIKGDGTVYDPAEGVRFITWYVMGADPSVVKDGAGNFWCTRDEWPRFTAQRWYLTPE